MSQSRSCRCNDRDKLDYCFIRKERVHESGTILRDFLQIYQQLQEVLIQLDTYQNGIEDRIIESMSNTIDVLEEVTIGALTDITSLANPFRVIAQCLHVIKNAHRTADPLNILDYQIGPERRRLQAVLMTQRLEANQSRLAIIDDFMQLQQEYEVLSLRNDSMCLSGIDRVLYARRIS